MKDPFNTLKDNPINYAKTLSILNDIPNFLKDCGSAFLLWNCIFISNRDYKFRYWNIFKKYWNTYNESHNLSWAYNLLF